MPHHENRVRRGQDPNYAAQMRAIGLGAQLNPGPGIGIQLQVQSKNQHRLLICGQAGKHPPKPSATVCYSMAFSPS